MISVQAGGAVNAEGAIDGQTRFGIEEEFALITAFIAAIEIEHADHAAGMRIERGASGGVESRELPTA
ncbi:hypothetical protein PPMP20_00635 [Paraburkholderia phymatum]|uniref:hypothetical protein n=1 Tax=Paraburkholderia phymatum TaxID=148447 RepID=UPI0005A2B644|nr:hypothetical protein [Paraburkholderia phymatum]